MIRTEPVILMVYAPNFDSRMTWIDASSVRAFARCAEP